MNSRSHGYYSGTSKKKIKNTSMSKIKYYVLLHGKARESRDKLLQ
jgi:hypothetical protein